MRFISVSVIVFFFTFICNITIASAQKDRSRKPETEAEIALDRILTLPVIVTNKSFTKEFVKDYNKQMCIDTPNYKECTKGWLDYDNDTSPWGMDPIFCSQDSLYGDNYTKNPYGELFEDTNCDNSKNSCYIRMENGIYYMKIEDGEWKINGIACGGYYIFLNVNRSLIYPAT